VKSKALNLYFRCQGIWKAWCFVRLGLIQYVTPHIFGQGALPKILWQQTIQIVKQSHPCLQKLK